MVSNEKLLGDVQEIVGESAEERDQVPLSPEELVVAVGGLREAAFRRDQQTRSQPHVSRPSLDRSLGDLRAADSLQQIVGDDVVGFGHDVVNHHRGMSTASRLTDLVDFHYERVVAQWPDTQSQDDRQLNYRRYGDFSYLYQMTRAWQMHDWLVSHPDEARSELVASQPGSEVAAERLTSLTEEAITISSVKRILSQD